MEKMSEVNKKYGAFGLLKIDDITTVNGEGINNLPVESKDYLANYGLFVLISRLTANEKDTSKWADLFADKWVWLMDSMPKVDRTRADAFTSACKKVMESDATDKLKAQTISALEVAFGKKYEAEDKEEE
jgi:poly(A) polymerase Pap1